MTSHKKAISRKLGHKKKKLSQHDAFVKELKEGDIKGYKGYKGK